MKEIICSKCGYKMNRDEVKIENSTQNIGMMLGNFVVNHKVLGVTKISDTENIKCPNCGAKGCFIVKE